MNRARNLKSSLLLLLAVCLLPGFTACTKQDTGQLEKKLGAIEGRLAEISNRLGKLEEKINTMESDRMVSKGTMFALRDRLGNLEKTLSKDAEHEPGKLASAGERIARPGEDRKAAGEDTAEKPEFFSALKESIKKELKEEDEVEAKEKRKKQAEQKKNWIKGEYEGKMKGFPDFAQKIGLSGSQETDIRQISEEAFEKVVEILSEAFEKPEDEVDWGEVKKKIDEIEKDAEAQIEPYVTEEQGRQLREFFDIGK